MKRWIPYIVLIIVLFTISLIVRAGNPPVVKWVVKNPFEQKVFVENKGQYNLPGKVDSKAIYYGARQDGLQYYFTSNGIWIGRYVEEKRTEQEIEELKQQSGEQSNSKGEREEKELQFKEVEEFHEIVFIKANPETEIIPESQVSQYYNFAVEGKLPVQAHGYKKITYYNLYSGIDMEFFFPEDKQGFKYSFIVHPGADISQIKIQYPLNEGIKLTGDGNVTIKSAFGDFIDHAPIAFLPGLEGKPVTCAFTLNQGIVEFIVNSSYNHKDNLVIDPWTATPAFKGNDNGYDVDWDDAGNCYVYGGDYPWRVEKFNPGGNPLWLSTESFSFSSACYGGFAVDRSSQSVYIIEGYDPANGAQVIKLNSSGSQIAKFPGNGSLMNEMWRIAFSRCSNEAVIGAGGTAADYQGCYLDTNLIKLTPVNVLDVLYEFNDVWGIALDNIGYCYMIGARPAINYNPFYPVNEMVKLPLAALTPIQWKVSSGYYFIEVNSVPYTWGNGSGGWGNGYNGMTVSDSNLYTYDSYVLKKWGTKSGNLIDSLIVNKTANNQVKYWGGLTSDECDNIFASSNTDIIQFNGNLTPIDTIKGTNTIYDVKLGNNNVLYACGVNFVEALQLSLPPCYQVSVQNQINNPNCNTSLGSVIATPKGGSPAYTITWNTTPVQTGDTAKNLSPGTYVATVIDYTCPPNTVYDTVQILPPPVVPKVTVDSPIICSGASVNLIAKGATTYTWSPSIALNATIGDSVIANPTVTTTYTVIGILNGVCSDTVKSVVKVIPLPDIQLTPTAPSICFDQSIIWSARGAVSYKWSPSTGLSSTTGDNVTLNPTSTTTYSITGIDSLGCASTTTAVVYVDSLPTASFVINPPSICNSQQIQFTNTSIGGNAYLWDFGDGTTDNSTNPVHNYKEAGVYTVKLTVTTANGCVDSTSGIDSVKSVNYGVHIANAFIPGSIDNGNNIFKPEQILCSENQNYIFRIYSRWGELLYETNDANQGWDGTYKGKIEPLDVYVYYIQYTCGPCTQFIKGNVTLLK